MKFAVLQLAFCLTTCSALLAQNPLFIPPVLSGTNFDLNVQSGTTQFYTLNTPTYGINGVFLSPTIVVNKGDVVTLNVINQLDVATTMHWHGLHVAPENDGGPHQIIQPGTSWSPSFEILNQAGTFWYHPHGEGKTELHVGKGLAGMFIVRDAAEQALDLPRTYGVDDIPLILQTKAFDLLQQIAIADHMDTAVFVNGTLHAEFTAPAQVVRLRLLNGSSMRSFNIGCSNNQLFYQIGTDGGLMAAPVSLNRLVLAPGERAEILLDLSGMNGQQISLLSYASELADGIFGGPNVGSGMDIIHDYGDNFLNGADFELLSIQVGAQTADPVTNIPSSLVPFTPFQESDVQVNRTLVFDTITLFQGMTPNRAEGPFGINSRTFHMDSVNIIVHKDATEAWTLINNTLVAHPFHIHDIQFYLLERSGLPAPAHEQGWKDVVLVMPGDSVKFITQFTTFSDPMVPYMYHCHLLHHEDDGMMGTFLVIDTSLSVAKHDLASEFKLFPNPTNDSWQLNLSPGTELTSITLRDLSGKLLKPEFYYMNAEQLNLSAKNLQAGIYLLNVQTKNGQTLQFKLIKQE